MFLMMLIINFQRWLKYPEWFHVWWHFLISFVFALKLLKMILKTFVWPRKLYFTLRLRTQQKIPSPFKRISSSSFLIWISSSFEVSIFELSGKTKTMGEKCPAQFALFITDVAKIKLWSGFTFVSMAASDHVHLTKYEPSLWFNYQKFSRGK